jgi:dihydroorotase
MQKIFTINAMVATSTEVARKRITITDEIISHVTTVNSSDTSVDDYYFNDDCLLFSGMGDIHIHAREDVTKKNTYKEDFESATNAALNGGVVHVADMPNNPIPPIDDDSYFKKVELSKHHRIPFLMYAGIGPFTNPLSYNVPYKAFMGPSIGELYFKSNDELENTIAKYRGLEVSFHCEDPVILEENKNAADHFSKRPVVAEILATEFALYLIEKYQLKGKLCHYSSGSGLDSIIAAKKRGVNVSAEVTPQHLFFSEEKIKKEFSQQDQTLFQMNPPIRFESDRIKLLNALRDGSIDYLATDHAPHSKEEKEKGMSGMPGLDTYGLFVTWLLIENQFDPKVIARICSENPGKFTNKFLSVLSQKFPHYRKWGKGLGFIEPGFSASFTVLNLKKGHQFQASDMKSRAHWSPFIGFTFKGSVESVFLAGMKIS